MQKSDESVPVAIEIPYSDPNVSALQVADGVEETERFSEALPRLKTLSRTHT